MTFRSNFAQIAAPLLIVGLASACGGKTLGGSAGSGEDSGTGATEGGGAGCVNLEVLPPDLACGSDQDCELVRTGEVCNGQCSCGDTPVNTAAAARFQSETASLRLEACPCADPGEARCFGGQCTLCGFGPNQPAGCNDAGGITTIPDGGIFIVDGGELDTAISTTDGATCVDIDVSTYAQSCMQASDCILIQTGEVCSGQCSCGGLPVSASEQSRYDQATSGITFGACSCPKEVAPSCFENRCEFLTVLPVDP
jgi:hypothetical protein